MWLSSDCVIETCCRSATAAFQRRRERKGDLPGGHEALKWSRCACLADESHTAAERDLHTCRVNSSLVRFNRPLLSLFLQIQVEAAAADGIVHDDEHRMLLRIARALGLAATDVEQIEALLRNLLVGDRQPAAAGCEDAYEALGVSPAASDAEVKKAYRRLMSRYHPDKFAGSGLPENMRGVAEQRVREIRSAYDTIKRQRGS